MARDIAQENFIGIHRTGTVSVDARLADGCRDRGEPGFTTSCAGGGGVPRIGRGFQRAGRQWNATRNVRPPEVRSVRPRAREAYDLAHRLLDPSIPRTGW